MRIAVGSIVSSAIAYLGPVGNSTGPADRVSE